MESSPNHNTPPTAKSRTGLWIGIGIGSLIAIIGIVTAIILVIITKPAAESRTDTDTPAAQTNSSTSDSQQSTDQARVDTRLSYARNVVNALAAFQAEYGYFPENVAKAQDALAPYDTVEVESDILEMLSDSEPSAHNQDVLQYIPCKASGADTITGVKINVWGKNKLITMTTGQCK